MARFKIDFLKDLAKLEAVAVAPEYAPTLDEAVAKGHQHKPRARSLGAMGFCVCDLNAGGSVVALEPYPNSCPDCDAELTELPPLGDARRYECRQHGIFRVSDTSVVVGFWNAPLDEQRRALKNARATTGSGQEPLVIYYA